MAASSSTTLADYRSDDRTRRALARAAIRAAMKAHNGNHTRAARDLGMGRQTLWRILANDPGIVRGLSTRGPEDGRPTGDE